MGTGWMASTRIRIVQANLALQLDSGVQGYLEGAFCEKD